MLINTVSSVPFFLLQRQEKTFFFRFLRFKSLIHSQYNGNPDREEDGVTKRE